MGACLRNRVIGGALLISAGLFVLPFQSLAGITFEKTYGGTDYDHGNSVQQTHDGGYIIAGETESFGAGVDDVYLVKTDSVGDTIWTRAYGGIYFDHGYSVQETQDGGYIIAGYTYSFGAGDDDVYLVKTDSVGDTIWTRVYGGIDWDLGYSVQQTQDGGYIIAGETDSSSIGVGPSDVYLVKTDSVGDTIWTRTYGGIDDDRGYSVQQTQDGGYIVAGRTSSFGVGSYDVYLVKTDSVGDAVWTRTYGGIDWDLGWSVQQTQDGGYIIAGETYSFGAGENDFYLIKTDSVGDTIWTRTYGGSSRDEGYSVQQTQDGGYVMAGWTMSFGAGMYDVYLVRTDSLGDSLWTRTYGGPIWDLGYSVQQTQDGGYVVAGYTNSFGAGVNDVYLIKTDENGLTGVEETAAESPVSRLQCELFQNSPNPFHRSTVISYSMPRASEVTLTIYDITGRLVETLVNGTQQSGIHQVQWDRRANPSGVYFYQLNAGGSAETRKMVAVE